MPDQNGAMTGGSTLGNAGADTGAGTGGSSSTGLSPEAKRFLDEKYGGDVGKLIEDSQNMGKKYGAQSNELGELRKKINAAVGIQDPPPAGADTGATRAELPPEFADVLALNRENRAYMGDVILNDSIQEYRNMPEYPMIQEDFANILETDPEVLALIAAADKAPANQIKAATRTVLSTAWVKAFMKNRTNLYSAATEGKIPFSESGSAGSGGSAGATEGGLMAMLGNAAKAQSGGGI